MVKKAVTTVAFNEYLSQLKQSRKLKNLSYEKFEIQDYIKNKNISNKEKQLLFSLRTRSYNVKREWLIADKPEQRTAERNYTVTKPP